MCFDTPTTIAGSWKQVHSLHILLILYEIINVRSRGLVDQPALLGGCSEVHEKACVTPPPRFGIVRFFHPAVPCFHEPG